MSSETRRIDKITVEIPEWAKDRNIYVTSRSELIGVWHKGEYWVKQNRCNLCGKCCIVDKTWILGIKKGSEVGWNNVKWICKFLEKEVWNFNGYKTKIVYVCNHPHAPFKCIVGPFANFKTRKIYPSVCCLKFKKVR